jgi:HK97 family phage prohead protease
MSEPELEYRTAATLDVRHPERVIDLIAVPYDEDCRVMHRGRLIVESIAPGSFAGVNRGPITVNREHDRTRPVGRTIKVHPNDPRGLRLELRIAKTPSGDECLELADEELLGASVGFAPNPGGESYSEGGMRRRITSAFVDHVAMTGDRAYDGAKVLAVRSSSLDVPTIERVPTPLLDAILAERRLDEYGAA